MKVGRTLPEVYRELAAQNATRFDAIAHSNLLQVETAHPALGGGSLMILDGYGEYAITDHTHSQLATHLKIPQTYYNRLRGEEPLLLDQNVNTLLRGRPQNERRMVRTLNGQARAFLSDSYRRLDSFDMMQYLIPELASRPDLVIESCELTDRKFHLFVSIPTNETEIAVGKVVKVGAYVSNSEIGLGNWVVAPFSYCYWCTNGATHDTLGMKKRHVTSKARGGDGSGDIFEFLSDEARQADDHALFLRVRDLMQACLSEAMLTTVTDQMKAAMNIKIGPVVQAITGLQNRVGLQDIERDMILDQLIAEGGNSLFELAAAITRTAQDVETYDRSMELQSLGGKIYDLSPREWHTITETPARRNILSDPALMEMGLV